MGGTFLTKKQKSQMRERRKKKVMAEKKEGTSKKRKREEDNEGGDDKADDCTDGKPKPKGPLTVTIPKDLKGDALRKFRKDARRKARQDGIEEVNFVVEGQENDNNNKKTTDQDRSQPLQKNRQHKKAKPAKSFPCINDLLKKQQQEKLIQEAENARQQADEALPDDYKSKYVALDCEMVGIGAEGKLSALARVSLVDWYGKPILDTFVRVPTRVTDFRTHVSGVTAKDIQERTAMDVSECRAKVSALLKGKILVGHALHNDLKALLLLHPKEDIRDTANYRPFQRVAGTKWRPRKLRDLVKQHLGIDIQVAGGSHDSVEDATATLNLFKRVRVEWEKELEATRKKTTKKKR